MSTTSAAQKATKDLVFRENTCFDEHSVAITNPHDGVVGVKGGVYECTCSRGCEAYTSPNAPSINCLMIAISWHLSRKGCWHSGACLHDL